MKRPKLLLTLCPTGNYVTRTVPASNTDAVGFVVRTHRGTYDRALLEVTISGDGQVWLRVARPGLTATTIHVGAIADDGLSIEEVPR
jgi:hypothetical protein